jgi:hypothetical protein
MAARRKREMATLEERVAYLEGQTADHAVASSELRLDVRDFRGEMNRRFDHLESRFESRFDNLDSRFDTIQARFDTKFMWLIGFQFTAIITAIAALLNGYFH